MVTIAPFGRATLFAALAAIFAALAWACLPDRRTLEEAAGGGEAGVEAGGCVDPDGFGGRGCFRCTPTTNDELLNACTASTFEPFDNAARIAGFDPSDPRPALPADAGPERPPFDSGSSTPGDGGVDPPAPPCPLDAKPNPVMLLGGTGFPFETIAKAMGTAATIFYEETGSCDGVAGIVLNQPKLEGEVEYFDNVTGDAHKCTLQDPHPADMTLSTLFVESCASRSGLPANPVLPDNVIDVVGPKSVIMFAVPATSPERVISAEAAYRVYGFGDASGALPWTDEELIFRRTPSSGNQTVTALTLGLPVGRFRGRDSGGSSAMRTALQSSAEPRKTIGISSCEIVDENRDVMRTLAYQHYGQVVGFYPDSDPSSFDRRNVRDGHYYLWAPLHIFVRKRGEDPVAAANPRLDPDGSKAASRDEAVKSLTLVMSNRKDPPVPTVDLLGALRRTGNVPDCAMRVKRSREGAPLEPYAPPRSCACAWEDASRGATPPECLRCADSTTCPSSRPVCFYGFCEE